MVVKSQDYVVTPGIPIRIKETIGDQQVGGSAMTLNGQPIPVVAGGETPVGRPGQDLRGSALVCVTTIKDVNPHTNNTSVTHELLGGAMDATFSYSSSVPADGSTEIYLITYFLK